MRNIFPPVLLLLLLLSACQPPVKTIPRKVVTGLDTVSYAAVLEQGELKSSNLNLRHLAGIQVKDRGWSRDCEYPEVVERARNKAMKLGGNVMIIVKHELPAQTGSSCSRIQAEVYLAQSLEGLESKIRWDTVRPLLPGDLRGAAQRGATGLPPVTCELKYRLLGDYFNDITVRTQTLFYTDSTWMPSGGTAPALYLRRAQLHFDLAELSARRFKNDLVSLAPDLRAITGQAKTRLAEAEHAWQQRAAEFDASWQRSNYSEAVLAEWEAMIARELANVAQRSGDVTVSLLKADYRKKE